MDEIVPAVLLSIGLLLVILTYRHPSLAGAACPAGLAIWFACSLRPLDKDTSGQTLRPLGRPMSIAHRGGAHDAPENTLTAVRQAAKNGADAVELDLEFTADGVPVIMHDSTVDRTTDGVGPLSSITYAELSQLNAASKHRLRKVFSSEMVPRLEEAVKECMRLNLTIYFDVKGSADKSAAALKQAYNTWPQLYKKGIVCSFNPWVIYKMRLADPAVVTALTHRRWSFSHTGGGEPYFTSWFKHYPAMLLDVFHDWAVHYCYWSFCGVSAFLCQKNFISPDDVDFWAKRGVEVIIWTVNQAIEKAYFRNVLDCSCITDSLVEDCEPHY
uniref:Glycerophosphodiester phosphodiesterase 1 n=1 Tax=Eptatretus burgeri TaxID=7764 RepID=A0A8C4QTG0_EPTBU